MIIEDTPDVNAPDPTTLDIIPGGMTIAVGEGYVLQAAVSPPQADQRVSWSSADPAIASVNQLTGFMLTGVGLGTVNITAESVADPDISETVAVVVASLAQAVQVSPASVTIADSATQQLATAGVAGHGGPDRDLRVGRPGRGHCERYGPCDGRQPGHHHRDRAQRVRSERVCRSTSYHHLIVG